MDVLDIGGAVAAAKAYTDKMIGQTTGIMIVPTPENPVLPIPGDEKILCKVVSEYTDPTTGQTVKTGVYSWSDAANAYAFISGDQFVDLTYQFKNNAFNLSIGDWDDEYEVSCMEINGKIFCYGKLNFKTPFIDVSDRHKLLEFPKTFDKKKKPFISIKAYAGPYKTFEAARHYYYDPDGEGYINRDDYITTKFPIKDLIIAKTIGGKDYVEQELDERGELVWLNDWYPTVRPNLKFNTIEIDGTKDYEINRVVRDYKVECQWVELDRSKFVINEAEETITYGGTDVWQYHGGNIADKPETTTTGEFYYAVDEDKLYRYVNNLYETYKWTTKTNVDFVYNMELYKAGCSVDEDGKYCIFLSNMVHDLDYMIEENSYDGTFSWNPVAQYGQITGMIGQVEGNALYGDGAIENVVLGGSY